MTSVNKLECLICFEEYNYEIKKPCIGTCGHTICLGCKLSMQTSKCPMCNKAEAFAVTLINYQVLEMIKSLQNVRIENSYSSVANSSTNIEKGACSDCKKLSEKLRICVTCSSDILIYNEQEKKYSLKVENDDMNSTMQKAIIRGICGDCALDGMNHEGHKTILLQNFNVNVENQNHFNEIKQKLLTLTEKKKEACQKFEEKLKSVLDTLKEHFEQHAYLESADEQRIHFNNVESHIMKMNNFVPLIENCQKRLEIVESEIKKEEIVPDKRKMLPKTMCLNSDEFVLIADRKIRSSEPLLISMFGLKKLSWKPLGRMHNPRSHYAVASNKSNIFVVGGMSGGLWLSSMEEYDLNKNQRREGKSMKYERSRTFSGFHNDQMYVAGGYCDEYLNCVEIYNPKTCNWTDGPSLVKTRADSSIVSCGGVLYVLGGYNGKEYEEMIEKLDEETGVFQICGEMQGSRAGFGACAFQGRIYIAGGWSSSGNTLKSVRSYDPMTNTWRDEPSLNKERKYFTLHATSKFIFAIRGCDEDWNFINGLEILDIERFSWNVINYRNPQQTAPTSSDRADASNN